jgi:hypothetical protein
MQIDESPTRDNFPEETFRISPAVQRHRNYDPSRYRLDPLFAAPVKSQLEWRMSSHKKQIKTSELKWEERERKAGVVKGEIRIDGGKEKEITEGKYRVDAGTAVLKVGGKRWKISNGGEFSVVAGERAKLASADDRAIVVTEFSV